MMTEYEELKKIVEDSGLFDKIFYVKTYPDILQVDIKPIDHFLQFGLKEDRKPNATFDPVWYREYYQDLKEDGAYPFVHYIISGKEENRFQNEIEKNNNCKLQKNDYEIEPSVVRKEKREEDVMAHNFNQSNLKINEIIYEPINFNHTVILNLIEELHDCSKTNIVCPILNFDINSFFNIDINKVIKNEDVIFQLVYLYLSRVVFAGIENGSVIFHKNYKYFNEKQYLDKFPEIKLAVHEGVFQSGFEHFCLYGYSEIIRGDREWVKCTPSNIELLKIINLKKQFLLKENK